jgi:hypothetical protein
MFSTRILSQGAGKYLTSASVLGCGVVKPVSIATGPNSKGKHHVTSPCLSQTTHSMNKFIPKPSDKTLATANTHSKMTHRCYHNDITVPEFAEYRKELTKDEKEPAGTILHVNYIYWGKSPTLIV